MVAKIFLFRTSRRIYNKSLEGSRRNDIDLQFTVLSFAKKNFRCYVGSKALDPVTHEGPLYCPEIQVRIIMIQSEWTHQKVSFTEKQFE